MNGVLSPTTSPTAKNNPRKLWSVAYFSAPASSPPVHEIVPSAPISFLHGSSRELVTSCSLHSDAPLLSVQHNPMLVEVFASSAAVSCGTERAPFSFSAIRQTVFSNPRISTVCFSFWLSTVASFTYSFGSAWTFSTIARKIFSSSEA